MIYVHIIDELLEGLLNHVKPAAYRMKNSIFTEEDIYFDEVKEYKELLEIVGESLKPLAELIGSGFKFWKSIIYFAFSGFYWKKHKTVKNILLIIRRGLWNIKTCCRQNGEEYEVKVIDVISYFELFDTNIENVDIIIVPLKRKKEILTAYLLLQFTFLQWTTRYSAVIIWSKRQVNETEIIEILDIINKNIDNEMALKNEL